MGGQRFTIVVHDRQELLGGRTVPVAFTVFFWDSETGALTATEAYRDVVVDVDGIFLPASRRVVRGDSSGPLRSRARNSQHAVLDVAAAR